MRRLLLPALLFFLLSLARINAQSLPLVPSNAGTEFWFSAPSNWNIPSTTSYYIRLYITSDVQTTVRVSVGGQIVQTISTVPYDIITVDLTPAQAQVVVRADSDPLPNDQVYRDRGVHIEAEDPVVVYCMNRTSYTSDGMLLYPVSALGRRYSVSSYASVTEGVTQELPSQLVITAPYDSTDVIVSFPTVTASHQAGATDTVRMNRGDVYSVMSRGYNGDVTGAQIASSQPVAVTAGNNCAYIPNTINFCCCDHIAEMMLPVETWGTRYLAVPLKRRTKGEIYRIVASEPNTTVQVDGVTIGTLSDVGGGNGVGWMEYATGAPKLVAFTADKPIAVTQYNPSAQYDGNTTTDPFSLSLTAEPQYLTETVFSTPASDFPENYLNFVSDSAAWHEVEIAPGGSNNWKKLDTFSGTVTKPFATEVNGERWVGTQVAISPGTYRIRSPRPFAGYLYGFGPYDSYGYPLGTVMAQEDGDTVEPLIALDADRCSGTVTVGVTDLGRSSGLSQIVVRDAAKSFTLDRDRFLSGVSTSASLRATLRPGVDSATVEIVAVDMGGNIARQQIAIARPPVTLSVAERSIPFGSVWTDSLSARLALATNTGNAPVQIDSLHLSSGGRFTILGPIGPVTLLPGMPLQVDLQFRSLQPGTWRDTLTAYLPCGSWQIALLEATSEARPVAAVPVDTLVGLVSAAVAPAVVKGDEATLDLRLAHETRVRVTLVDANGAEVRELIPFRTVQRAVLPLDLKGVSSGSYLVRIVSPDGEAVRHLVVTR